MASFAYTTVPGKVAALLEKMKSVGVPPKATNDWLKSIGFTSSNDRSLLAVLKQIGLIDASGQPTKRWRDFRGTGGKQALADAIRTGYSELFATYSDADSRAVSELENFFKTHTDAGQQAIDKTVSTFRALAGFADFSVPAGRAPDAAEETDAEVLGPSITGGSRTLVGALGAQPVTININVQLVLPESNDETVYDKFFAAMRRHLLEAPSE